MKFLLFKKRAYVLEIICEILPRYGVVVVVVEETEDISKVENLGIEISDMFLKKFIIIYQMYKLF
ncbi:hypothetical protein GCM10023210_30480 [Chryseobacterium ginsengisoli]|uniref:EAL domain-containing protein n=1 Tax=Chryseobacterium ginsengisoli TaxID=363853 RepID=A0ABP9MK58_9FLAO